MQEALRHAYDMHTWRGKRTKCPEHSIPRHAYTVGDGGKRQGKTLRRKLRRDIRETVRAAEQAGI